MKKLNLLLSITVMILVFNFGYAQSVSFTLTQAPCNANGVLTANFTGMTPPLTVVWGNSKVVHTGVTGTSDALTGYAGQYLNLYATDANNNKVYGSYNGAPPFSYTVSATGGVCPVLGTATATVTGGTSPYTYQWTDANSVVVSTSNPATGLQTGSYDVMITDANGCVFGSLYQWDSGQGAKNAYIYNTSNISYSISTTTANCTNGTATVNSVSGGTSPYSYLWSNSATTSAITGLTAGYYYVTVTDAVGCSTPKGASVQQSRQIGTNITSSPATCLQNNGSATSFGSGGIPPYTYLWSNSATTQTISGLPAGYYSVKVTDANGCVGNGARYISASTPVNVTYTTTASSCTSPTGTATLNISGGTTPYTVQWYTSPAQSGTTLTNAAPGSYSFKVTDANGCIRNGTVQIPPVSNVSVVLSTTNTTCTQQNGSINAVVTGGSTPYTYLWSNSATTSSISGLASSYYSVTVTDNLGCAVTKGSHVGVSSPVSVGLSTTNASCIFNSDGAITATPSGGTTPYTYQWSNVSGTSSTVTGLSKGFYTVNVTDAVGCKATGQSYVSYNPNNNSCYCTITGTVYNDANSNCVKDAGEQGIENIRIHCSGIGYAYTNANGVYSFIVPSGSYTLSETVHSFYPLATCQNNSITVNATAGTNCVHIVNFANTVNTIHDMYVGTANLNCPVPGYQYRQRLIIKNMGTVTESSVVAGYKTDGQLPAPLFSPSNLFTGSGTYYSVSGTSLNPGISHVLTLYYNTPTNIPLNTSLVFKDTAAYTGPMSNWLNDYSPWNNVDYFTPLVVGSFDPNFKEVKPQGKGPEGIISVNDSVLEYKIHFQNLGTYKAQNIYILDTLDSDLDWATLTPIYKSHDCDVTMSENGVVRFQFDNIDLPTKTTNEEASNGLVIYTIHTKKGLPNGTKFTNNAAIYFDFNEPVITNTTLNTIGDVSVETIKRGNAGNVSVFPNPTHDIFTIRVNEGNFSTARVMNAMGQICGVYNLSETETQVNLSSSAPGIYFIVLQGMNGYTIEKVEKL
ncbi:MAG: T9SS type A sorting domain-containing protein [Chitinophagaceae bacterium]|nr:T9SS type A sorting domain-containing protein [Chitinophagaceae bacterium]MCB9045581.1 T9SS type A sorting domain-containing protein [Chitinophagales bacterium]